LLKRFQDSRQLYSPYWLGPTDLLQRVLIDSPAHEFPLGTFSNSLQLFIRRDREALSLVLDSLEFQQTQIFAFFPVLVGFLPDVDWRPIRNDVPAPPLPLSQ